MNLIISLLLVSFALFEANGERGKLEICLLNKLEHKNTAGAEAKIISGETVKEIFELFKNPVGDEPINFSLDNDVIRAKGYVKNINIDKSVKISICTKKELPFLKNITLSNIVIHGDEYYLNGTVADIFYIEGRGTLDIKIEGLTAEIYNFGIEIWPIGCFRLDINVILSKWTVQFQGIMNGDPLLEPAINDIIGEMGSDIVDYLWSTEYVKTIAPIIQKILDKYINHRSELGQLDYESFLKNKANLNTLQSEECKTYDI